MCGRYAQARNRSQLQLAFDFPEPDAPAGQGDDPRAWPPVEELTADYNIAPGSRVQAVLGPPPRGSGDGRPPGPRYLRVLRWGLVPSWAKDLNMGYRMINARSETVADKPAYRDAFAHRRCLLPADAYYEWQLVPERTPGPAQPGTSPVTDPEHAARKARTAKRPFAVRYADGRPLALAGVFERWRDPQRADDDPAAWLWSCAVITAEAAPELAHIHERMPVVLDTSNWGTWLDPAAGLADLLPLMAATPASEFTAEQVTTAVNSVRNNGPELLEPVEEPPEAGVASLF
ncbi:SOS response-associated peptidase [Salinactinospora qingdaonensis]|uniref:Abasic site processing protein n=1 Tax=Salinactinospora qingdaonensis TaxID=702744 RepID=A0ABP7G847_9ACTN